jgi:hypothetical protein
MLTSLAYRMMEEPSNNPDPSMSVLFQQLDAAVVTCLRKAAVELCSMIEIEDQSGTYADRTGFLIRKRLAFSIVYPLIVYAEVLYREGIRGRLTLHLLTPTGQTITLRVTDVKETSVTTAIRELARFGYERGLCIAKATR